MKKGSDSKQRKGRALVVMAKEPLTGLVKTRLSPYLTPAEAATLYDCLLVDIVTKIANFRRNGFWIAFTPEGEEYFRRTFINRSLLAQRGNDLGERLHHVFVDLFHMGYEEIIVTDSDSPTVPISSIKQAYKHLGIEGYDVVLGPSSDGGYYLIGLKRPLAELFRHIPWSTERVLQRTLARADRLGLKVALLPPAFDIDVKEDLNRLWNVFETSQHLQGQAPKTYAYLTHLLSKPTLEQGGR